MSKKKASSEPSVFRFMCVKTDNKNYHLDFQSKEEAIQYSEELSDSKIEWWGIYEIKPNCDYLITVTHKRLIPHDDRIYITKKKENREDGVNKRKHHKKNASLKRIDK